VKGRVLRGRSRRWAAAVVAAAALAGTVLSPVPAHGQSADATTLRLVSQKLVLNPEEPLTATLAVTGTVPDGTELVITVSSRLRSPRDDLHALLDGGDEPGSAVDLLTIPIAEVPHDAAGRLSLNLPTVRSSSADSDGSLRFSAPGLYPVTFELRTQEDDVLASLLSFVDRRDDAVPVVPMSVALVASVNSPPAAQVNGSIAVDERARADLTQLVAALQHNPEAPTTVSLPPELLERLSTSTSPEDQQLVQDLATALTGRQVLSRPYVTMDPSSSARSGLSPDYTRLLSQGEDALRDLLPGVTPDRSLFLAPAVIDDAGLQLLRNLGTLNVVLPPAPIDADATTDTRLQADPTHTVELSVSDGSVVRASILERSVIQRIVATPDPVLAAHYVAVELLTLRAQQADQPSRGVAVRLPDGVPINAVLLGTLEDLLGQISELKPVELGTLFATTAASKTFDGTGRLVIPPPGGTATDRTEIAGSIAQRRLAVGQVTSMLQDDDALEPELSSLLDLALAEDLTTEQRDRFLTAVDDDLGAVTSSIVPMDRRQFTITSRRTTIPISVRTTWPEPLKVKVRLTSPKLRFPEGDQVITVTDDSPPFRVPVEAKSNGTFRVTATFLTPEGDALLAPPMTITVRSTALSGLGILVTIAAALALVAWWLQHLRSKRRRRSAGVSAQHHPTAAPEAQPGRVEEPSTWT
jgi:hypothetical protein